MRARTTSRTAEGTRSAAVPARTSSPTKNGLPPERRATAATKSGSGDPAERGADLRVVPSEQLDHQPAQCEVALGGPDGGDDQQPRPASPPGSRARAAPASRRRPTARRRGRARAPPPRRPRRGSGRRRRRARTGRSRRARRAARAPAARPRRTRPSPQRRGQARPRASQDRRIRRHGQYAGAPSAAVQPPHSTGTARAPASAASSSASRVLPIPGSPAITARPGPAVERRVEQRDELGQLVGPSHEPRLHGAEPYPEYVVPRISAGQNARTTFGMTRTALRAARLFDGVTTHVDPLVLVEDGRITEVRTGPAPADVEVIDLGEATLLPGLIDTHVHLAFDAGLDPVAALAAPRRRRRAGVDGAGRRRTAARGRHHGARPRRPRLPRPAPARDPGAGLPTIVAAGPPITSTGGHCHFLGGVAERGVRDAVREHAERGVDVIKVMASGGFLTSGTDVDGRQFSPDDLVALVDEAHRHGLPVTAHAHALEAIVDGVAAGVDGLEHCSFVDGDRVVAPDDLVATIVRRRIAVGATLGLVPTSLPIAPPPELMKILPARLGELLPADPRRCGGGGGHRRGHRPGQAARRAAPRPRCTSPSSG